MGISKLRHSNMLALNVVMLQRHKVGIWFTLSMFCCCNTLTSAKLGKMYLHNIKAFRLRAHLKHVYIYACALKYIGTP